DQPVGVVHFLNELPHSLSWRGPAAVAPRLLTELSTDCVGNCDGDRPSPRSHPGRVLLRRRRVHDCRSTAPGAKGEAGTPNQPLFAPGAGAPTQEARVECRSTALGAKGQARTPSQPLFAPGAGAPTQEARADCRSTALGAKGEARTPSRPLFVPGA